MIEKLLKKCFFRNSYSIGKNYWEELLYKIYMYKLNNVNNVNISLSSIIFNLDLRLGEKLEDKKIIELGKKKKISCLILDSLNIDYSNKILDYINKKNKVSR